MNDVQIDSIKFYGHERFFDLQTSHGTFRAESHSKANAAGERYLIPVLKVMAEAQRNDIGFAGLTADQVRSQVPTIPKDLSDAWRYLRSRHSKPASHKESDDQPRLILSYLDSRTENTSPLHDDVLYRSIFRALLPTRRGDRYFLCIGLKIDGDVRLSKQWQQKHQSSSTDPALDTLIAILTHGPTPMSRIVAESSHSPETVEAAVRSLAEENLILAYDRGERSSGLVTDSLLSPVSLVRRDDHLRTRVHAKTHHKLWSARQAVSLIRKQVGDSSGPIWIGPGGSCHLMAAELTLAGLKHIHVLTNTLTIVPLLHGFQSVSIIPGELDQQQLEVRLGRSIKFEPVDAPRLVFLGVEKWSYNGIQIGNPDTSFYKASFAQCIAKGGAVVILTDWTEFKPQAKSPGLSLKDLDAAQRPYFVVCLLDGAPSDVVEAIAREGKRFVHGELLCT